MKARPVLGGLLLAGFIIALAVLFRGSFDPDAKAAVDSARIHNAAKAEAEAGFQERHATEVAVLSEELRRAREETVRAQGDTDARRGGVRTIIQTIKKLVTDPALMGLVRELGDSLRAFDSALVRERLAGQAALDTAQRRITVDSLELLRRAGTIAGLQRDIDLGLDREEALAKRLGGWRLAVTLGPGASFDGRVRLTPVQATVGLSRSLRLPRLIPKL